MKGDMHDFSRINKRAKRRKMNIILNSLIAIVLLLIIVVAANIFWGDDERVSDQAKSATSPSENENNGTSEKEKTEQNTDGEDKTEEGSEVEESAENDSTEEGSEDKKADDNSDSEQGSNEDNNESEPVVAEGGSDPNVRQTIIDPNWEPVGTSQTGEHVAVYDTESVDWQEMLNAVVYASGVEEENLIVWFMGNNGHNKSVATVSSKDDPQAYRVYIEWVDQKGWKPVKIEELIENDKKE